MSTPAEMNDRPVADPRPLGPITRSQQLAAKVVGVLYLVTMATSMIAYYMRAGFTVSGNAVETAKKIAASEQLYRISIVSDLITVVGVLVLIWALYVVLSPVSGNGALLATVFRIAENCVVAATLANAFVALRLLRGAPYLQAFEMEQLQVLSRILISGQVAGLQVGFIFLGLGSTIFSWLWLRSRYIPPALAIWGIFSSLVLALVGLAIMLLPQLGTTLGLTYMAPMFFYEVGLGGWLLFKGLREPVDH